MPYSLISESWIPVIRRHSGACWIRPAQIVENIASDPVMAIGWPRADFRLASMEFLIGLLAVACPPTDARDWRSKNQAPPNVAALDLAFAPLVEIFNLDGDGPRFMQDFHALDTEVNDVATLLIEAPGEQSIKKNADLLNKRGQVKILSRSAAAIALFTLQTYAPAGGAGNRTGLRGGGPLTTLVMPPSSPTFWHLIWANVPNGQPAPRDTWPRIFPWLTTTLTSENARSVGPGEELNDPLVFWGTPRRIRLVFEPSTPEIFCDLTGQADELMVTGWQQRPNGANYTSEAFNHPLTPRYKPKPNNPVSLPVHPQPDGIGYRDFLGLLFQAPDGSAIPAACVTNYVNERRSRRDEDWRILAAGYDMDNMKARSFVEAELPVFGGKNGPEQAEIITQLICGAEQAATILRSAVRYGLFAEGAKPKINTGLFTNMQSRFWAESEVDFYNAIREIGRQDRDQVARGFLAALGKRIMHLFNEVAPITASDHPERVARAAKMLTMAIRGYGKLGSALFDSLNLPAPVSKNQQKGKSK